MKQEWQSVPASELEFYASGPLYTRSVIRAAGCLLGLMSSGGKKVLLAVEEQNSPLFGLLEKAAASTLRGRRVKVAPLTFANFSVLAQHLPYMAPVTFGRQGLSLGLGDRLGLAAAGHVQAVRHQGVRPVLAQQSIRELTLTGRSYEDVLAAAAWGVFEEGYGEGFCADADHLKNRDDIRMACDLGFTMITLDCSEHIVNGVEHWSEDMVEQAYHALPQDFRRHIEETYGDRDFRLSAGIIRFPTAQLRQIAVTYGKALHFCAEIYREFIKPRADKIDFEVSIDETAVATTPAAHYFVAAELERLGVLATSLAPRFCGEFQKGIDYIGDLAQFQREFVQHAAIADLFGYRLSIHSGSDKLSVYPIIGKHTGGRVHVKTAGTNWLEALKVISRVDAALFRELYSFAAGFFPEACRYYHVSANPANFRDVTTLSDQELPLLLTEPDSRQLLHITYGGMLTGQPGATSAFRKRIYNVLYRNETAYAEALAGHIGHHILALKTPPKL